jgi:small subunit ribosomal protein S18
MEAGRRSLGGPGPAWVERRKEPEVAKDSDSPRGLKRKYCKLCFEKVPFVGYKDEKRLQRFITDRGKIVPRRVSGCCNKHQAQIKRAVKRARALAMLPFTSEQYR